MSCLILPNSKQSLSEDHLCHLRWDRSHLKNKTSSLKTKAHKWQWTPPTETRCTINLDKPKQYWTNTLLYTWIYLSQSKHGYYELALQINSFFYKIYQKQWKEILVFIYLLWNLLLRANKQKACWENGLSIKSKINTTKHLHWCSLIVYISYGLATG